MTGKPRFTRGSRAAALVVLVGLITALQPWTNGSSSAASMAMAEPQESVLGPGGVLERPLGAPVTVTNTNDAGAGSLRNAIATAAPGDTVVFAAGVTGTITLTSGALNVNKNLTIQGPGANNLAVSGNNASKVFIISAGTTVSISGLTVQNGTGNIPAGSGIENNGNLTLTDAAVVNNGVVGAAGGGIFNNGQAQLTMSRVLVANNRAGPNHAGGLVMNNPASMTNVTFFGNQGGFGAIFDAGFISGAGTAASMLNVTITQNTATLAPAGGGISWGNTDQLTVRNTIVANNSPRNCTGTLTSQGNNLEDTNTCGFNQTGDLPNTPPGFDAAGLASNGGPTQTVRIQRTSAAFNGVTAGTCPPPANDQRNVTRPQGPRCDIGAVELILVQGDINADGIVDILDYGIWRQNFGQTGCPNVADVNGDCIVDILDYGIWRLHFGQTAFGPPEGGGTPAAPR
jgi:hypothetical protein